MKELQNIYVIDSLFDYEQKHLLGFGELEDVSPMAINEGFWGVGVERFELPTSAL